MNESSKEAGIIAVLLERFETQRLPRALALKEKVDKGERLSDWDTQFMEQVLEDTATAKPFIDEHPELHSLYARAIDLYEDITAKALENEKSFQGSQEGP
jgi:hypothetical protein